MNRRNFLAGMTGVAMAPLFAPSVSAAPLTAADRADIVRAETYLNSLHTMKARLVQSGPDGSIAEGTFYLSRPGKLRLEYDPPTPILLISNGSHLIHYDSSLKTTSHIPLESTPAGILVRPNVKLSGDVTVTAVEHAPNSLYITMIQTKDPRAGNLTLVFSEQPFGLARWGVVDGQGQQTQVALHDAAYGMKLEDHLFVFADPLIFGPGRRE